MAISKVIHKLGDNISTSDIYPDRFMPPATGVPLPHQCAFGDDAVLNGKLINKIPGQSIALVCGKSFGSGLQRDLAVKALVGHLTELNVIVSSATQQFDNDCRKAGFNIIICPTLKAEINDDLEIQTNKVINRTQNRTFPRV